MAAFNKFNQFVEDLGKGVHNLSTNTLKVMLTNTAPVATNTIKANLTEISAGNGYTAGGGTLTGVTWGQVGGVASLVATDFTFTAAGGTIGPLRYVVVYNDTPTSPADPLICWWDYGSSITLADTEPFLVDFSTNILTNT